MSLWPSLSLTISYCAALILSLSALVAPLLILLVASCRRVPQGRRAPEACPGPRHSYGLPLALFLLTLEFIEENERKRRKNASKIEERGINRRRNGLESVWEEGKGS